MPTYLGPSIDLTLADGTVVHPGDECELDAATQATLEKAGLYFSDTAAERDISHTPAPQSASENLAEQGTTATAQAEASGLSVGSQTAPAPSPPAPPAPPPVPPVPAPTPPAPTPPAPAPAPPPVPPVPPASVTSATAPKPPAS